MLDIAACARLIDKQVHEQQSHKLQQLQQARSALQQLAHLQHVNRVQPCLPTYSVCGIDGSQIYPDRHEGFHEYLINIGVACFEYALPVSRAQFNHVPYLFSQLYAQAEYVNAQRTLYELKAAVACSRAHPDTSASSVVNAVHPEPVEGYTVEGLAVKAQDCLILFDGALFLWHLQTPVYQEQFLALYLAELTQLQANNSSYAGYISASHARDLVTMIEQEMKFDYLVDTDIVNFFLKPGEYTQLFHTQNPIHAVYPPELKPCFAYLHAGSEIVRIELPTYQAHNLDSIMARIMDQVHKGAGYPIALAEAHEQAVVRAADRDFFYALLRKQYGQSFAQSPKLFKKHSALV